MVSIFLILENANEYWLTWSPSYNSKNKFRLNIKSDTEAFASELKVAEKQIEFYPKKKGLCEVGQREAPESQS